MDHSRRQHSSLTFSDDDSMPDIHDDELLPGSDARKVQKSVKEIETRMENKFVNIFSNYNVEKQKKERR